jgi:hypothetical protein
MDFDARKRFGNVMSCTHHKIFRTSLSNLAPKLKIAENWKSSDGFSLITPRFQVICWDIY